MKKNGKRYDEQGIEMTMKPYHFIGDGAGQIAINMGSTLIGFLTYFYTEKVGLSAAIVGTLILVKNIIDAFTDVGMGYVMDHVHSKKGKARPWLLWMAIPMFFGNILQFAIPEGVSDTVKYVWMFVSVTVTSGVIFTAISIPYNSLITYLTKSIAEKRKIGIIRASVGVLFSIFIGIIIMPVTNAMGGDQAAWVKLVTILSAIATVCLLFAYAVTKERNTDFEDQDNKSKYGFGRTIKNLFSNHYWVIMLIVGVLINIFYAVITGSGVAYYTQYVLGDSNLTSAITSYLLIPLILGFVLTGPLFKKWGMVRTIQVFQLIGIAGCVVRIFAPTNLTVVIVTACLMTFASTSVNGALGVLVNYTAVYNKLKYGDGMVSMTNGASSFGYKVGTGLGSAVTGWILAFGGYNSKLAVQPASVVTATEVVYNVVPLVAMALVAILLIWFDLDKKYPEMMKQIEAKENA